LHCTAMAETTKPNSAPTAYAPHVPKTVIEECENEWSADKEAMMKRDMDEDSYVAQCSVKDDVPPLPEPKANVAPAPAPK